jgi:hypothetical protein
MKTTTTTTTRVEVWGSFLRVAAPTTKLLKLLYVLDTRYEGVRMNEIMK